jgi:hypothetical protein
MEHRMSTLANPSIEHTLLLGLDFDGVLHRFFPIAGESDARNAKFAFLPEFEGTVRALRLMGRDVRIVVTSTWRNNRSLSQLRAMFSPDIQPLVVGATPKHNDSHEPGGRRGELEAWIRSQGLEGIAWVGVDDIPEMYGPGACVVACHDEFGPRERALLLEAAANPAAYALKHPCR